MPKETECTAMQAVCTLSFTKRNIQWIRGMIEYGMPVIQGLRGHSQQSSAMVLGSGGVLRRIKHQQCVRSVCHVKALCENATGLAVSNTEKNTAAVLG